MMFACTIFAIIQYVVKFYARYATSCRRIGIVIGAYSVFCCGPFLGTAVSAEPNIYGNAVISEDVTWRGKVTVNGSVTVAPQATLRIEPGTTVYMVTVKGQQARLVVQGRLLAAGTKEKQIVFTGGTGKWGGILLLSSMKKNHFEQCRIDAVDTAIEARYSSLVTSGLQITGARNGIILFDSILAGSNDSITGSDVALQAFNSELELKGGAIGGGRIGVLLTGSSTALTGVSINGATEKGLSAASSRLKISSCTVSDNRVGMEIRSSEGDVQLSRLSGNHETALHGSGSALKITRCQITGNSGTGLKLDDNRATIWDTVISGNSRANVEYGGEQIYTLAQIWWGTADEAVLSGTIRETGQGKVTYFPWLRQAPLLP
jgi:hypothetical protein